MITTMSNTSMEFFFCINIKLGELCYTVLSFKILKFNYVFIIKTITLTHFIYIFGNYYLIMKFQLFDHDLSTLLT